jgi:hypothetical protein
LSVIAASRMEKGALALSRRVKMIHDLGVWTSSTVGNARQTKAQEGRATQDIERLRQNTRYVALMLILTPL